MTMPFGLKIAILNRAFRKRMDEKAAALGLTSVQLRVLGSISRLEEREEEVHQNDLERLEHVTHPAMTKLLQRLKAKGMIRCAPSARDRRYKQIHCTGRSAGIHRMILEQDAEVFDELCRGLSAQQREQLVDLVDLLLKSIGSQ